MAMSEMTVDEFHRVRTNGLHDSVLSSLQIQRGVSATLCFIGPQGTVEVLFEGLGEFGMEGFRDGAIVSSLYAYDLKAHAEPPAAWAELWAGDSSVEDSGSEVTIAAARTEFRYLAVLENSYGGSFACLCKRILVGRSL